MAGKYRNTLVFPTWDPHHYLDQVSPDNQLKSRLKEFFEQYDANTTEFQKIIKNTLFNSNAGNLVSCKHEQFHDCHIAEVF